MRVKRFFCVILFLMVMAATISGCSKGTDTTSFTYKGIIIEGYDPLKHRPSPEFKDNIKNEKVMLTNSEIKTIKKCIRLFYDKDLSHLLKLTNKFVIVNCPFSFADKPHSTIYLDRQKVKPNITIGNDWDYKLMHFGFHQGFHFKGNPEFPNLFRIMLHELGHLVEYKKLEFSWKGQFVANDLNRDFVRISWNEQENWKDRESLIESLHALDTEEQLLDFIQWFKDNSSFFSIYSATGMNEDFAEAFVYYYLSKYYNYTLDLVVKGRTLIEDVQKINYSREKKLKFIETIMAEK